jgi:hypothetical protein
VYYKYFQALNLYFMYVVLNMMKVNMLMLVLVVVVAAAAVV